ncbi:MAG: hypothetical protein EBX54_08530, partial [Betaproteobacteria bacterium]|nr:hypothetical protein [Betaproteobacteria bacterium]
EKRRFPHLTFGFLDFSIKNRAKNRPVDEFVTISRLIEPASAGLRQVVKDRRGMKSFLNGRR